MKIIVRRNQPNLALSTISSYGQQILLRMKPQLVSRTYPRNELCDLLQQYNTSIGNDALAFANIQALKSADHFCIVTGQQLGLMGGPSYTILKAITCLLLAKATGATPIFWLASEDHDVAEIDHTYLLDGVGNIQKFHLSLPKDGRPVEDLQLTAQHVEEIRKFCQAAGVDALPELSSSYETTMASFLVRLFLGTGLVFIVPHLLRPLSVPFFQKEIEGADAIQDIIQKNTNRIANPVLSFKEDGTNLFFKDKKYRRKVFHNEGVFTTGSKSYSQKEFLAILTQSPELFSTNVASRPVLQSALFPTMAYVGGPTELQYYQQLEDYHSFHDVPFPEVVPRISSSLISPYAASLLQSCGLEPWSVIPHHWIDLMPSLGDGIESMSSEWRESALSHFQGTISEDVISRFVKFAAHKIQRKISKQRLKKQGIPPNALHYLRNLLTPHHKRQERVLNWLEFQGSHSENLIFKFLEQGDLSLTEHLYCFF